ncbi:MAG: zinc-binding dehydrogenase [bacterium]
MVQAKLVSAEKIKLEKTPIPSVASDEVLIQVKVCGICGSDIHAYKGRHPFVHPPIVLGHEFSGMVSEIGSGLKGISKGEKVTVEPNIVCGRCYNCLHGRYNICLNLKVIGCVGYNGAFAEYIVVPKDKVVKLPQEITYDEAALIEPAAVAVHAVKKAEQRVGGRVVILGAGPIGLLVMQMAKISGADEVIITDLLDYRLKKARDLGADRAINSRRENLVSLIKGDYGEAGIDLIYDCVGIEETVSQAIQIARKGTKILIVGVPEEKIGVNLAYVQDRELEILGSLMYLRKDFTTAIELIHQGKVRVGPLISHHFTLEEIDKAFQKILNVKEDVLKVLVQCPSDSIFAGEALL